MKYGEWREIPSLPNYEASCDGNIRQKASKRLLKTHLQGNGYLGVHCLKDGKDKSFYVHRLVCEAFNGEPKGRVCNHKDYNRTNNRADNLEWVSIWENVQYSRHRMVGVCHRTNAGATGEKYINKTRNSYRIVITRKGRQSTYGRFPTLEEAIKERDSICKALSIKVTSVPCAENSQPIHTTSSTEQACGKYQNSMA